MDLFDELNYMEVVKFLSFMIMFYPLMELG